VLGLKNTSRLIVVAVIDLFLAIVSKQIN